MVKVIPNQKKYFTCTFMEASRLIDLKSRSTKGFQMCGFEIAAQSLPYMIYYRNQGRSRKYEDNRYIPVSRALIDILGNYRELSIDDFNKFILPEIKDIKDYKELRIN